MSKARIINFKPTPRPKSNLIPFLSVVLIGTLITVACINKENKTGSAKHKKDTTFIDLSNRGFIQELGDSIWYEYDISGKLDTILAIKGLNPVVVIKDNGDTSRYWQFEGDTIHLNVCKPDTVYITKSKDVETLNIY